MRFEYRPAVQADYNDALNFYEMAGENLADRFDAEFKSIVADIKAAPRRFPFYLRSRIFRCARLTSFPFLVVYRERPGAIRVAVLKHERRHPRFGMSRR